MKNIFFSLCLSAILFSCTGPSRENVNSAPSQVREEDKTAIELLREISLLYDDFSRGYKQREREVWDNARNKSDVNKFVKTESEMKSERNDQIRKKLVALKGKEIPLTIIPDSTFEVVSGKIRHFDIDNNEVALKITFFVKLKKDYIPTLYYDHIDKKYHIHNVPGLEIRFRNTEGKTRDYPYTRSLFNYDKIKRDAVYGKVYAHKGDECNEFEPGISIVIKFGPKANVSYSDLASIEASISY